MDFIEKAIARDPALGLDEPNPNIPEESFEYRTPPARGQANGYAPGAAQPRGRQHAPYPQHGMPPQAPAMQPGYAPAGDQSHGYGYGYMPPEAAMAGGAEPDLKEIFAGLWRGKWFVLSMTLAATVLAAVIVSQIPPRFVAESRVLVAPGQNNVVNLENVLAGLPGDRETISSQVEVIRSRELTEKVVDRFDIRPLSGEDAKPGLTERVKTAVFGMIPPSWLELIGMGQDAAPRPVADEDIVRQRLVDTLRGKLQVYRQAGTRVLVVRYESSNPSRSATIADAFADMYIEGQREAKLDATREASNWLRERVGIVREQVQASEAAVVEYRRRTGLVEGTTDGVTLGSQQMSELSSALVAAQGERMNAESRWQQVQSMVDSGADAAALQDVMSSPVVARLLDRKVDLELSIAELNRKFTSNHPDIGRQKLELGDIRRQISSQVQKTVNRLQEEFQIAEAREASIKSELSSMTSEVADSDVDKVRLRDLQREAQANRTLLETLLTRLKETKSQEDISIQQPDARILSRATTPGTPSFPNSKLLVALAFVGALLGGLILTFMRHILEPGFRSAEQIERTLGLTTLALVPMLTGTSKYLSTPIHYIAKRPRSALAESIRFLNANVRLGLSAGYSPKVVLLTSAQPAEGKTSIALAMAQERAMSGFSTVVVDADLRRGSVEQVLNLKVQAGLGQMLAGKVDLQDVLQGISSGVDVVPAGPTEVTNVSDLLSSKTMDNLLDNLANNYDMVIVDAPPVMVGADALILHKKADATLFVVRWSDTNRKFAKLAVKRLVEQGNEVAGAVLSMVNIKAHSSYGYADSGYYSGRLKKYYTG